MCMCMCMCKVHVQSACEASAPGRCGVKAGWGAKAQVSTQLLRVDARLLPRANAGAG
jgi:hypothetical protein